MAREGVPLWCIQRQFGHANLGITSIYLQGIDNSKVIDAVHARHSPVIPATAGLNTDAVREMPIAGYLGPRALQPPGQGAKVRRADRQLNWTEPAVAPAPADTRHTSQFDRGRADHQHADRVEFEFLEQRLNASRRAPSSG